MRKRKGTRTKARARTIMRKREQKWEKENESGRKWGKVRERTSEIDRQTDTEREGRRARETKKCKLLRRTIHLSINEWVSYIMKFAVSFATHSIYMWGVFQIFKMGKYLVIIQNCTRCMAKLLKRQLFHLNQFWVSICNSWYFRHSKNFWRIVLQFCSRNAWNLECCKLIKVSFQWKIVSKYSLLVFYITTNVIKL